MVSFHFNGCWRKCICYSLVLLFNLWREVKCILLKITRSTRSNFLWRVEVRSSGYSELDDTSSSLLPSVLVYQVGCNMLYPSYTLQGTDISQLGNRKIIFKSTFKKRGYYLVSRRVSCWKMLEDLKRFEDGIKHWYHDIIDISCLIQKPMASTCWQNWIEIIIISGVRSGAMGNLSDTMNSNEQVMNTSDDL